MIFLKNISVSVSVKWMMPKFLFILKNPREVFLNLSAIDVRRFSFISIANEELSGGRVLAVPTSAGLEDLIALKPLLNN